MGLEAAHAEQPQTRHHAGVAHGEPGHHVAAIADALVVVAGDRLPVDA